MPYKIEQILLIALVNFVIYFRTLRYGCVSDDINPSRRPVDKVHFKDKSNNMQRVNGWIHKRWVQIVGLAYFNVQEGHLYTMLIHTLNCILLYIMFGCTNVSFLAALLFAINPVNSQGGGVWMSGKIYSISSMLGMLCFINPILSPLFYFMTRYFMINVVFAPLLFLFTPYKLLALMPVFGVLFYKDIMSIKAKIGTNKEMRKLRLLKLVPFFKSFGYYLTLSLIPWRLALYHSFLWGVGVNKEYNKRAYSLSFSFWYGLASFIGLIYLMVLLKGTIIPFCIAWFIINIAMWCNIITLQQQISERCVYFANIGLTMSLATLIYPYPILIAIIVTYYLARNIHTLYMYANEYWHTEVSSHGDPHCNYIWVARGIHKYYLKDVIGAYLDFMEAKIRTPWEFKANFNAANMAVALGKMEEADKLLQDCLKTPYEGQESAMYNRVESVYDWIKDCKENKRINMDRCQIIR